MEERKNPNPMGKPRIDFTDEQWETIKGMCAIMCTGVEIAGVLGVSYDTLKRRVNEVYGMKYEEFFAIHSAEGKSSLRRAQWDTALGGNAPMQIWLGKNYLDQTDKQEIDNKSSDGSMSPQGRKMADFYQDNNVSTESKS